MLKAFFKDFGVFYVLTIEDNIMPRIACYI